MGLVVDRDGYAYGLVGASYVEHDKNAGEFCSFDTDQNDAFSGTMLPNPFRIWFKKLL
jgi:hypothetical protein